MGKINISMRALVRTGSRIHIALIDLNASIGRVDGSIGFAIAEPGFEIEVEPSARVSANYRERELTQIASNFGRFSIRVRSRVPEHCGFGSTTQLLLGVAKACSTLAGKNLSAYELAKLCKRGGTSGIGTHVFARGGFVLDAGHRWSDKGDFLPSRYSQVEPPKLVLRKPMLRCSVLLHLAERGKLYGKRELRAFKANCPIPRSQVQRLSHLVLMKLLPALVERDLSEFGSAINDIQKIGFKKIEWGFQSKATKLAYKRIASAAAGAGLSSFGPLVYGLFESSRAARALASELGAKVTKPLNSGAKLELYRS